MYNMLNEDTEKDETPSGKPTQTAKPVTDTSGHDWANDNMDALYDMLDAFGADAFAENTTHVNNSTGYASDENYSKIYRDSQEHYESMVNNEYKFAAPSNVYARWYDDGHVHYCQYDLYLDACE